MKKPTTPEGMAGPGQAPNSNNPNVARQPALKQILADLPGNSTSAQRGRLAAALVQLGTVTTYEAMRYLDIYDPRPRVHEMRHAHGWDIATIYDRMETESGQMHRVGRYVLIALPGAANDGSADHE